MNNDIRLDRCKGCDNYVDTNGKPICGMIGKPIVDISDEECLMDGEMPFEKNTV